MTHSNTLKQKNKLFQFGEKKTKQNSKAVDYVKAYSREKIREVIHYCPELDICHFWKTWGRILKRFF